MHSLRASPFGNEACCAQQFRVGDLPVPAKLGDLYFARPSLKVYVLRHGQQGGRSTASSTAPTGSGGAGAGASPRSGATGRAGTAPWPSSEGQARRRGSGPCPHGRPRPPDQGRPRDRLPGPSLSIHGVCRGGVANIPPRPLALCTKKRTMFVRPPERLIRMCV